jgi:hypothetical protein
VTLLNKPRTVLFLELSTLLLLATSFVGSASAALVVTLSAPKYAEIDRTVRVEVSLRAGSIG